MLFAATTKSGNTGYIQKSTDGGKSWSTVWDGEMDAKSGENRLYAITSGNGMVVAVGNSVVMSKDGGSSWTETHLMSITGDQFFTTKQNALTGVAYGDGMFVAAGPHQIIYSTDGVTWTYLQAEGENATAGNDKSMNADDAKAKAENAKGKFGKLKGLSKGGLKGIAKGGSKSTTKEPKTTKEFNKRPEGSFPSGKSPGLQTPLCVRFIDGKFFVMGGNMNMKGMVLSVKSGKLVAEKSLKLDGNAAQITTGGLKSLATDGNGNLVAVSNSTKTAFSTDGGNTWKYKFNPAKNQGWAVAYGNGKFVAADPFEGVFYTSDIATGWEYKKRAGGRGHVNDLIFANGRFILVGNDSITLLSADGLNWELASTSKKYGMHIMGITYLEK